LGDGEQLPAGLGLTGEHQCSESLDSDVDPIVATGLEHSFGELPVGVGEFELFGGPDRDSDFGQPDSQPPVSRRDPDEFLVEMDGTFGQSGSDVGLSHAPIESSDVVGAKRIALCGESHGGLQLEFAESSSVAGSSGHGDAVESIEQSEQFGGSAGEGGDQLSGVVEPSLSGQREDSQLASGVSE
jgi:hypothetical protein